MNRVKFSQHQGLNCIELPYIECEPQPKVEETKSSEGVFDIIFANDPLTGRPRSDLGTYMTDNCNPLVRDFIDRNLRNDFSQGEVKVPDGISDTDVHYLTRDRLETDVDYINRVNRYMLVQRQRFQNIKARKAVNAAAKSNEPKSV